MWWRASCHLNGFGVQAIMQRTAVIIDYHKNVAKISLEASRSEIYNQTAAAAKRPKTRAFSKRLPCTGRGRSSRGPLIDRTVPVIVWRAYHPNGSNYEGRVCASRFGALAGCSGTWDVEILIWRVLRFGHVVIGVFAPDKWQWEFRCDEVIIEKFMTLLLSRHYPTTPPFFTATPMAKSGN